MATPVVLGFLGKETASRGLNANGLVDFLMNQKNDIMRMAPPGLANVLGLSDLSRLGAGASQAVAAASSAASSGSRRLLPILAIAALALIAWMLLRGGKTDQVADSARQAADEAAQRTDAFVDQAGDAMKAAGQKIASVRLPDGVTVDLLEGSFNHGLATFLSTASTSQLPKAFVFDHLNFESATTTLTPDSNPTVTNLIAILKAYPSAQVRLEGHTDTAGDPTENQRLSMARADAVKAALVSGGIAENRITTAGYGATRPTASNETEEGRAQNRRLELVVTKV
jgi:outer membrane protein OmpA-like peptidoglycan-associated protein